MFPLEYGLTEAWPLFVENDPLMSSFVVWSDEVRYVWNPASPITDHTERKQIADTITLNGDLFITSRKSLVSVCSSTKCVNAQANINTAKKANETMNM